MPSTDPRLPEQRLGAVQSLGCVRIPASLNEFLDQTESSAGTMRRRTQVGRRLRDLPCDGEPTRWTGSNLLIVDSQPKERPARSRLAQQR